MTKMCPTCNQDLPIAKFQHYTHGHGTKLNKRCDDCNAYKRAHALSHGSFPSPYRVTNIAPPTRASGNSSGVPTPSKRKISRAGGYQ